MKNIIYIGQFKDASGYGNAARGYLTLLHKYLDFSKYNLKIIPLNFEKEDYSEGEEKQLIIKYTLENYKDFINQNKYYLILHGLPNFKNLPLIQEFLENKNCIKKINMISWETDKVPDAWLKIYKEKAYDELFVTCEWNKEVYEKETQLKTSVVHLPVYDYYNLSNKTKNQKFNIFSMSQWSHRKGFDILVRAYCQEFFNQDDVELFIKTYRSETMNGFDAQKEKQKIIDDISSYKNSCINYDKLPICKIKLQSGFCTKDEIKSFYDKADVFCSPTRGEGFGLTIAQAALSGIPCIVPNMGGHLDFLNAENNYFIDSRYEPVYNMPYSVYSSVDMNLVEPSLLSTRKQLRKAYNDWKEDRLYDIGLKNKNYALTILDEKAIYTKFMQSLE